MSNQRCNNLELLTSGECQTTNYLMMSAGEYEIPGN